MGLDIDWWKENVKLLRYSVEVYVDDYEGGEGEQVHDWSETVEDFYGEFCGYQRKRTHFIVE